MRGLWPVGDRGLRGGLARGLRLWVRSVSPSVSATQTRSGLSFLRCEIGRPPPVAYTRLVPGTRRTPDNMLNPGSPSLHISPSRRRGPRGGEGDLPPSPSPPVGGPGVGYGERIGPEPRASRAPPPARPRCALLLALQCWCAWPSGRSEAHQGEEGDPPAAVLVIRDGVREHPRASHELYAVLGAFILLWEFLLLSLVSPRLFAILLPWTDSCAVRAALSQTPRWLQGLLSAPHPSPAAGKKAEGPAGPACPPTWRRLPTPALAAWPPCRKARGRGIATPLRQGQQSRPLAHTWHAPVCTGHGADTALVPLQAARARPCSGNGPSRSEGLRVLLQSLQGGRFACGL